MNVNPTILRRAAFVLDNHRDFAWTVQGFGMIRTYLDPEKEWRLNVWDNRLRVPDVSEIHDHPWDFQSLVLAGQLANTRFCDIGMPTSPPPPDARPYQHVEIKTGEGGGPIGDVDRRFLLAAPVDTYIAGQTYGQVREEIHLTKAVPGTVTLNQRSAPTEAHTANIYWPRGPWVNAEPRPATKVEQYAAVEQALYQARLDKWARP